MLCFGLLIMFCDQPKTVPIDSFCTSYERVIRNRGDGAITAPLSVKQRIAANDVVYRCTCQGWTDPICRRNGSPSK